MQMQAWREVARRGAHVSGSANRRCRIAMLAGFNALSARS